MTSPLPARWFLLLLLLLLALPACAKAADSSSSPIAEPPPPTLLDASPPSPTQPPGPAPSPDAALPLDLPLLPRGDVLLAPVKPPRHRPALAPAFAQLRPRLRRCYTHALAQDPALTGSLTLVLTLAPNGDVTSATAKNPKGLPDPVVQCMLDAIRRMELEDAGATGGTLELPIVALSSP